MTSTTVKGALVETSRRLLSLAVFVSLLFLVTAGDARAQGTDDHGNSPADATPLALGQNMDDLSNLIRGRIDPRNDVDYFRLDVDQDMYLVLNVLKDTDVEVDVDVFDQAESEVKVRREHVTQLIEIKGQFVTGTYYVGLTGHATGVYTIFAVPDDAYTSFIDDCQARTAALNNPQINDDLYGCQWNLQAINVEDVWAEGFLGEGINIAVVDDGMDVNHVDLFDNVDSTRNHDYTGRGSIYDPLAHHGTGVAGIIAARDNSHGIRGVAPRATLYGHNLLSDQTFLGNPNQGDAMTRNMVVTAVSNNSWTGNQDEDPAGLSGDNHFWRSGVESGISEGYHGKGVFYVFGAGNDATQGGNANLDEHVNFYAVTTVCAVNDDGRRSLYSEKGANLWLCAPSDGIGAANPTIVTTANADYYRDDYGGTSAAAPIVSGVAALMRQANPDLTWRDLKLILAATARKTDASDAGWEDGFPKYGSDSETDAYHFNHEYGFGVVDAAAAVDLARAWTSLPPLQSSTEGVGLVLPKVITDNSTMVTSSIELNADIRFTEFVSVNTSITHASFRDLDIELVSPQGRVSKLVEYDAAHRNVRSVGTGFRFGSAKHLGEDPNGMWQLRVTDSVPGTIPGLLNSWSITVYGHGTEPGPPPATDSCFQSLGTLTAAVSLNGTWTAGCEIDSSTGPPYARYYSFSLTQEMEIQIDLASNQSMWLLLMHGAGTNGAEVEGLEQIVMGAPSSPINRLQGNLEAGTYTAMAIGLEDTGDFTLSIVPAGATAPPPATDGCFHTLGTLTAAATRNASWTGDCASTHRSGSYARFYSFTLSQQTEVQIDLTSAQDTFLYLLRGADANGAVVTDNDDVESGNTNSRITRTLAAGTYTIEATTYGEGVTGDFTLSIVPAGATAPPPATDSCFQTLGALTAAVTRDASWTGDCASTHRPGRHARFYSFTLSQQTEVQIDLTSSQDTFLYLLRGADANGAVVTDNDDVESGNTNSRITRTLAAGTYTIEATTYGEGVTGDFTLSIVPAGATAPPPATDSCFQTLGALTAAVTRDASWTGDCASTHRPGRHARFYSFTLSQQTEVQIDLTSSQDTFLYLLRGADANGAVVTDNDDVESGNTNSRITRTLAAGTYTIEATTYGEGVTGDFTLSIVPAGATAPPPATDSCFQTLGALTAAVTRDASWTGDCASTHRPGRHARFYSFTLSQQTEVQINLTSSQDTFLYLLRGADANGTVVTDNDDVESGNTNSHITRTLAAGTYTIEATTYGEGVTGDFTLSIVPAGATAPPQPPPADACEYILTAGDATAPSGGSIGGQWTGDCASTNQAGSYARYYTFTLPTASEVTITLESSVDTFLYLLEGAGTVGAVVAENDDVESGNTNSQITEFLAAGTYTIEATTYKEAVTGEFTLTVTSITVTPVPGSEDREALVALYHATGGANWRSNRNWLSNTPLDQWYGVTTNSSDRVTELELSFNGLTGQLPTQVGSLSSLTRLDLSDNQLSGQIPVQLGNLSDLEELDLWFNQLSGEIPVQLGNLSNLEVLNFWNNQLSGRIPVQLGNLSNLTFLGLGSNRLSGEIPSELGRLSNLTSLSLSDNRLSGEIPPELGDISNLASLYLSGNQLTGCIPQGLQDVANNDFASLGLPFCASGDVSADREALVALYHATGGANWTNNHNWLSSAPIGLWYGVTTDFSGRVTELDLHENGLNGQMPLELDNLSNITVLVLSRNQLSGQVPAELGHLSKLEWLNLASNQLRGEIPSELGRLSNLTLLYLSNNRFSGRLPAALGNLSNLTHLSMRGNEFTGPIPSWLSRMTNLQALSLRYNRFSGTIPSWLGRLTEMQRLYLSYNQLSGEIPPELSNLTKLTLLYLEGNQLTGCIPEGLQGVANNDFASLDLPFCGASGSPDLVVQSPSVSDSSLDAGEYFTFYAQVHNQGDGVSASTTLRYYRSDNDTISTSDTEVGTTEIVALGASQTWSPPSIGVNAPSRAGTYYYGACVDPVPAESNTRNNCSTAETVIVGAGSPDLVVQSPSVSDSSLDAGEYFTFYAQVHNQGDGVSASTTLRYYRSDNDTISTSDTEVGTTEIVALGASQTWSPPSIGVNAPSRAGTYYYGACVDPVPAESNTRNNCSTAETVIVGAGSPDLVVQSPSVSDSSLDAGEYFTFYAQVHNQGDGVSASTTLRYYRSDNDTISTSDTEVGTTEIVALGASQTWSPPSIGVNAPSRAGTYYYGACVDPVPAESNTRNNCSTAETVIVGAGSPDLVVQSPSVSDSSLDAGEYFTFYAQVHNQGDGVSASTTLRYYRSDNDTISTSDTEVGTTEIVALGASQTWSPPSIGVNAPSRAGTYYYGACVDPVPAESNTRNNCSTAETVIVGAGSPDLVVQSPSVSDSSLDAGEYFTFYAQVHNQGDGVSASTTLRYYRSDNDTISTSDTEVGTTEIVALGASQTWSPPSIGVNAPSRAGTYYYGACVDPVPAESNTRNNCSTAETVIVGAGSPDLVVQSPSVSDSSLDAGAVLHLLRSGP